MSGYDGDISGTSGCVSCADLPARTLDLSGDGRLPERWRRPEATPCSTPTPGGRLKKAGERAVLTPGGRPAARCGAENRPRPDSQFHGLVRIWDCYIKKYIQGFRIF